MRKNLPSGFLIAFLALFLFPHIIFADSIAPAPATAFEASLTSNKLTLTFKECADKDLSGYLVLRVPGIGYTTPAVVNGTSYSTGTALTVSTPWEPWVVLSNNNKRGNTLELDRGGSYTYLIYMRDKSKNYSQPSRIVVNNSSPWTTANIAADLLVLTGGELSIGGAHKLNLINGGSIAWFAGNLHNDGIFDITSAVTVPAKSALKNGKGTINVKDGGALYVAGSFNSLYGAANLNVVSGGLVNVQSEGLFVLDQGKVQVKTGGTMHVAGTVEMLPNSTGFSNAGNLTFASGGRLNQRKNVAIPAATWQDGSVMAYYGDFWQDAATAGMGKDFSNFIWNLAGKQGKDITLPCDLKVRHTLRVENTNGRTLVLNPCNNYNIGSIETTSNGTVKLPEGYIARPAAPNASLPVELLSFKISTATNGAARLAWSTATEKNNDVFIIERSEDGKNWRSIGEVKGAGTVSVMRSYTFTDIDFNTLQASEVYYRLRQTDFDGTFSLSKAVRLQQAATGGGISQVYYNTAASVIEVDYQNTGATAMQFVLADANGRIFINQTYTLNGTAGRLAIPVQQLANGLYVAKAAAGQAYFSGKFIR